MLTNLFNGYNIRPTHPDVFKKDIFLTKEWKKLDLNIITPSQFLAAVSSYEMIPFHTCFNGVSHLITSSFTLKWTE